MRRILALAALVPIVALACLPSPPPKGTGDHSADDGGSSGSSSGTSGSSGQPARDGGGTPDGGVSGAFPLTITSLTPAATQSANLSFLFAVTDAKGAGVTNLTATSFDVTEDGAAVDLSATGFQAASPSGTALDVPTVLMLDLSGNVTSSGSLAGMQGVATTLIDAMMPEQRMAIVTYADQPTTRTSGFTADKAALKTAVGGITSSAGVSSNLYGSLTQTLGSWNDGFASGAGVGTATAGLLVVITDKPDSAGVTKLSDVITARGNKRILAVGVGSGVDGASLKTLASGGYITVPDFASLPAAASTVADAMTALTRSVYLASYCSPKRAAAHKVTITVKGNESYVTQTCTPATFSPSASCANRPPPDHPEYTATCGPSPTSGGSICCDPSTPYACSLTLGAPCYATVAAAQKACGSACIQCGGTGQGASQDTQMTPGPSITVPFTASNYSSGQCPAFWGAQCKALQACCKTLPSAYVNSCESQLMNAAGNETTCQSYTTNYCPAMGPSCTSLQKCCGTFAQNMQQNCFNAWFGYKTQESTCAQYEGYYCPTGTQCARLKTCCAAKTGSLRDQCEQQLVYAQANEAQCQSYNASYSCP